MSLTRLLSRLGLTLHHALFAAQFLLLIVGLKLARQKLGPLLLGIAALALLAWVAALRRRRVIAGTPTSRIASAAQGYVELRGRGQTLDAQPLSSPLSGRVCLWYRYMVERINSDHRWECVEQEQSTASFVLDDGSGRCLVDPEGAEILTRHCKRWEGGNERYAEWALLPADTLYVYGNFVTRHPDAGLDADGQTRELLAQWKQDQGALLRRFDLNRDGKLDEREWTLARRLARGEIEKRLRALRQQSELHLLRGEGEGLYLISNHEPQRLARRYLALAAAQLLIFFLSLATAAHYWPAPAAH